MRRLIIALTLLAAAVAAAPAQAQNRFFLVNQSGEQINEAYVSSARVTNWGPDILGAGVLPSGNRVWVTPTFGDCVLDVRVVYASGRSEERRGLNACSIDTIAFGGGAGAGAVIGGGSGAGAVIGGAPVAANPSFNFVNQSGAVIREIYVSSSRVNSWGGDRLGANTLSPGGSVYINLPASLGCNSDIRVVYMNGAAAERRGIETCSRTDIIWR
ncbi:Tat pathway signal protein [Roseomonas sp. CCTCC AB2023176]|uniref:Tat pathway signal protein n=1 Tax=Roseomonas sp. CCTCC AB2023176 TaxID=3342640 RepID=UPI0035DC4F19